MIISSPGDRLLPTEAEQAEHPLLIQATAAAAELCIKVDLLHLQSLSDRTMADFFDRPDLTGPHHLVLVEQEHRHPGRIEQLIDLETPGPVRGRGVPVGRDLPDAVRFVADQDAQPVRSRVHEIVEVLEHALDRSRSFADIAAHGLREGLRTSRMQYRSTLPGKLSEEGESDHALAAAGTAGHDDSRLGVPPVSPVNGMQDESVGELLFRQEHELILVLDFGSSRLEQLTGRPYVAGEKSVGRASA